MQTNHFPAMIGRFLALTMLATLALSGCSQNDSVTGMNLDGATLLVTDPLDGSLNSTAGSTPPDPQARIDRLAEALGLDETQKAALAEAYASHRAGMMALKESVEAGDITHESGRAQAMELRETFEAALQLILTPEQWDQLQQMRANHDGRGRGRRNPIERWNAWLTEIGAKPDQVTAVFAALQIRHDGMKAIGQQVKNGTLTREQAIEAAKALRDAFDAALQTILTPEQYTALEALRPDCAGRMPPAGPPPGRGRR